MQDFEERLRMCVRQEGRHVTDIIFRMQFGMYFKNALKYLLFCVIKTFLR